MVGSIRCIAAGAGTSAGSIACDGTEVICDCELGAGFEYDSNGALGGTSFAAGGVPKE